MKNIKFILAALVAVFVTLGSTSVYAQEDANRDANGSVVRGPYVTNGPGSNWFLGLGGGFDTSFRNSIKPFGAFSPENNWGAQLFVGKWFTPTVGARLGYQGVMNTFGYDTDLYDVTFRGKVYENGEQVRFGYVHTDLLWNASNAIGGYKETRFWDIIPYIGAGYLGINNGGTDNKFGVSAGIYNEFRLGDAVNLFVDVNLIASENPLVIKSIQTGRSTTNNDTPLLNRPLYMPTASVGIAFNLSKKKNFDRLSSVVDRETRPLTDRIAELEKENKGLTEKNKGLAEEKEALAKKLTECQSTSKVDTVYVEVAPTTTKTLTAPLYVYFELNKAILTDKEASLLDHWLEGQTDETKASVVTVTGSADMTTGTRDHNQKLATERAELVRKILVNNGFKAVNTRIVLDDSIGDTPEKNRVAVVQ